MRQELPEWHEWRPELCEAAPFLNCRGQDLAILLARSVSLHSPASLCLCVCKAVFEVWSKVPLLPLPPPPAPLPLSLSHLLHFSSCGVPLLHSLLLSKVSLAWFSSGFLSLSLSLSQRLPYPFGLDLNEQALQRRAPPRCKGEECGALCVGATCAKSCEGDFCAFQPRP